MSDSRDMLRHTLATLAYRGAKAVREAPDGFGDFHASPTSRTPSQILAHICDLMDWALSQARGKQAWTDTTPTSWSEDSERLFKAMRALDAYLASSEPLGYPEGRWGEATYENEYVREQGKWRIARLHGIINFYCEYDEGWHRGGVALLRSVEGLAPDRPPSIDYQAYPEPVIAPFHYDEV